MQIYVYSIFIIAYECTYLATYYYFLYSTSGYIFKFFWKLFCEGLSQILYRTWKWELFASRGFCYLILPPPPPWRKGWLRNYCQWLCPPSPTTTFKDVPVLNTGEYTLYMYQNDLQYKNSSISTYIFHIILKLHSFSLAVIFQKYKTQNRNVIFWMNTVEPHYNKYLGTMNITLLCQVSHIRVKIQRNIKIWDQLNHPCYESFFFIYPTSL